MLIIDDDGIMHDVIPKKVIDDIKTEIAEKHFSVIEKTNFDNGRTYGYEECLSIIDKHIADV